MPVGNMQTPPPQLDIVLSGALVHYEVWTPGSPTGGRPPTGTSTPPGWTSRALRGGKLECCHAESDRKKMNQHKGAKAQQRADE